MASVLILDDEPLIAMLVQDWIEDLGYEVIGPARSVRQALTLIDDHKPDAAILDVSLGESDSFCVADALKSRKIPFAFGTGRDAQAIPPNHANAPMLFKPYDISSLKRVMSQLLC